MIIIHIFILALINWFCFSDNFILICDISNYVKYISFFILVICTVNSDKSNRINMSI